MIVATLYALAVGALAVATGAVSMALIRPFPVSWLYRHYFLRKPAAWGLLGLGLVIAGWTGVESGRFPWAALPALALLAIAVPVAYRLHQENAFPAVDFPPMAEDPLALPLNDDHELAVIEHQGVSRAYPLDYVIHHHVINDRFGDALIALTYCAMCRSIIAFDVTALGSLFVGSFKHANMIVADRRTKTFFQQATAESIIGPLHPRSLQMVPFQLLTWRDVKRLQPVPQVAAVTEHDLRAFELPIPGIWKKIMASEATPGLPAKDRDGTLPPRTFVAGILEAPWHAYVVEELRARQVVEDVEHGCFLVATNRTVNAFRSRLGGRALALTLDENGLLRDERTGGRWDLRGRPVMPNAEPLVPVPLSTEYWFSRKQFHSRTKLVNAGRREDTSRATELVSDRRVL